MCKHLIPVSSQRSMMRTCLEGREGGRSDPLEFTFGVQDFAYGRSLAPRIVAMEVDHVIQIARAFAFCESP